MASFDLSPLQRELLEAFFASDTGFFLSGGGALVGFYLHHRDTKGLDLFAMPGTDIDVAARALRSAAAGIGAAANPIQESPDFRRFAVQRGAETTLVDLVIDRAPQAYEQKATFGRVRVDPVAEIAANKLCTIIGRALPRDLLDLKRLLDTGLKLEDVMRDAQKKDASAEPATIAWVLNDLRIGPNAAVPAGTTSAELNAFREQLIAYFSKRALPEK